MKLPDITQEQWKKVLSERDDARRRAEQMGANVHWLLERIDAIHDALCPGCLGTWQERTDQAVAAAQRIAKEKA
jgi:hypothetical protein